MKTFTYSVLIAGFLLGFGAAYAQIPRTISFQGVLADANGNLVPDGNHQLKLALYTAATGGSALYTETQTVPVVKGVFNAIIGSVTAIPKSLAFDNAYFLGVSVDNGSELAPRTALNAVPYAFHAGIADVANSLASNATGIVTSVNNQTGALMIQGGGGTTITNNGSAFTISSVGGTGTGIQGVQNSDGTLTVQNPNGPVATLGVADASITSAKLSPKGAQDGQVLTAKGTDVAWSTPSSGGGIQTIQNADGSIAVTNPTGPTTEIQIPDGAITTNKLADNSVTPLKLSALGASSGQALMFNGANIVWSGMLANITLPYKDTVTTALSAFHITNQGSGPALHGMSASGPGVVGESQSGTGVVGTSQSGIAGLFSISSNTDAASALQVSTVGTGHAGYFKKTNSSSTISAVEIEQNGAADGLHAWSSEKNGVTGMSSSTTDNGVYGLNSSGGSGVMGSSGGRGAGVEGVNNGSGHAGYFHISNASNGSESIYGGTAGSGIAASFFISNSTNGSDVLLLNTNGTGDCLTTNHTGASGNLAVFQSASVNKARIDKTGKGFFNGGTQNSGADVAEAFDVEGARSDYEPGDVLVISTASDRSLEKSSKPYSNLVAGVYATKPGVLLTNESIDAEVSNKAPLGVIGVIPTKVCLEGGPIHRGDLLVTSSQSGAAMKADVAIVKEIPGAIIGKALQPYDGSGVRKIDVLVNVK